MPLVNQRLPDVALDIIGSHMPDTIKDLGTPLVRPIGYVADAESYFVTSRVFVAPLRFGAGMKGKVGQSMSYGLPVVTTSIGAEGMMLIDGDTALIADTPEAFARAIVTLYTDEVRWRRIATRSKAHIERHFSDEAARTRLVHLFGSAANNRSVG
jgi:glycosyltransferase involved in cell wall biosynthesis